MLKIILLICSFILPVAADEAKHSSFLDTGGIELPRIGSKPSDNSSNNQTQELTKNLVIPTVASNESETITDKAPAGNSSNIKTDSVKKDNPKSFDPAKVKDKIQEASKPSLPINSQTVAMPSVKMPLPPAPNSKPIIQTTTTVKPDTQTASTTKPAPPALPSTGPYKKTPLPSPTLLTPGPAIKIPNTKLPQIQTAQQVPNSNTSNTDSQIESTASSPTIPSVSNVHEVARTQTQVADNAQQTSKSDISSTKPQKAPIPKPPDWTFKDKIKSYSIVKKPIVKDPKQVPYALEPKQLETAKAKKPTWSFKSKKDAPTTSYVSKDPSKKSSWSFKKVWSFKKKGKAKSLDPIDLTPLEPVIQEAKNSNKDSAKPAYSIKPKKIQVASNAKAYSIKEKDQDFKEKQALEFEAQELKVVQAKDYDDSLDRLSYNEYTKLFWSKFSTKREKERAIDIKSYLDNYYKYYLDKKTKRRN